MRILYIDIDCCRADHLSCNGYDRKTTPNIDRLSEEGISFTNCHASNSPCLPSRASLFTGRFGFNNGIVSHYGSGEQLRSNSINHEMDPECPFWIHHLWSNGFRTVAFSSFADRHNAWWWSAGWEEHYTPTHLKGNETAPAIVEPALEWLENNADTDNWFLDVHVWDAHCKYRVPKEWLNKFRDCESENIPSQEVIDEHRKMYGPRTAADLSAWFSPNKEWTSDAPYEIKNPEDVKKLIDFYDGSIAYVDYHVGKIIDVLEKKGVLEDTAIIISADHGDSFSEMGQYMDHGIANIAVHNIPLVIKWPNKKPCASNDSLIYNVDLCPTICDLLGLNIPTKWDGKSFAKAINGDDFKGYEYLVFDHGIYTLSRTVRTKDYSLMQMYHPGLINYDNDFYLHNLVKDPKQRVNLYEKEPEKFNELSGYLIKWRQEQVKKGGAPDPLEGMVSKGAYCYASPEFMEKRLKETGREHLIDDLRQRIDPLFKNKYRKNAEE